MSRRSIVLSALLLAIALLAPPAVRAAGPLGPPGAGDLVVFIAKEEPQLFRLVGHRAVPFGQARLEQPIALAADQRAGCFYILDNPKYVSGNGRLIRVAPDGRATVLLNVPRDRWPFDKVSSLSMGADGGLYMAGQAAGLYRMAQGGARRVALGDDQRLERITAALALARGNLLLATAYRDDVDPGSESRAPTHRRRPGDLMILNLQNPRGSLRVAIANQKQGGRHYDTWWRTIGQMLVDSAGRIVLVDSGSRTPASKSYTGYQYQYQAQQNPLGAAKQMHAASNLNGGVLVIHPNGRLEDLTYKNPGQSAGPLRHPQGIAQWDQNTYLVADPQMHVPGRGQAGGLMLLMLDGSRDPRWSFGRGIRPHGVAILRGAGAAAPAAGPEPAPLSLSMLTAPRQGGDIIRIDRLKVSRKGQPANTRLYSPFGQGWSELPRPQAIQRLRQVCQGAAWRVRSDGAAAWLARGAQMGQAGPFHLTGTCRVERNLGVMTLGYRTQGKFDTQHGSLKARLMRMPDGGITAEVELTIFTKGERIQAVFNQALGR